MPSEEKWSAGGIPDSRSFDYDVAIIGGGSAGYAAARTSASAGLRTVLIDGGAEAGGLCILRGCMPTKSLLYAAEAMHFAGKLQTWGILAGNVGFDFGHVMARKNAFIEDLASSRREELTAGKFEFLRGRARFLDPHTVELEGHGTLTSAGFVITTGSSVSPPPLPGFHEAGYLTSDDALELTRLPESLVILGGGAVAVEFALFFARFGVRVTLIQRSGHLLSDFDSDVAEVVEKVFRQEGIEVFTNTKITGVLRGNGGKTVSFEQEGTVHSVSAAEIMLAIGRDPNTASLDLDKAGVATEHGRIIADDFMRTSTPHIYAAGDCTGPHSIVHLAVRQGEVAAHNIVHPGSMRKMDVRLLLAVIFTDPQVAQVGLTEKTAAKLGIPYLAASYPFSELGKSVIMDATDGHAKLLADPETGEIIGGACVGPLGGELIHEIVAAMAKRMTVHELAALPHYHPTLAEIWTYPAEELSGRITLGAQGYTPWKASSDRLSFSIMKTLFTSEVISKGARSGSLHAPDGLLDVTLGNPLEKGIETRGPNPETMFAGAYSACYHGAVINAAERLSIPITDSTVRAVVSLIEEDNGCYRLEVELHALLPGIERAQAQRIMEAAHQTCPYSKALRGDTAVTLMVDSPEDSN